MVRIVSGTQQDDPNAALLSGTHIGRAWGQARDEKAEVQRRQQDQLMQMQQIQMQFQQARAEREQILNQQAQMGDAQAIQEMQMRAQMDPTQQLAEDGMKLLEGITDPKARAIAMPAIKGLVEQHAMERQKQAVSETIQGAVQDGVPGSEMAEQRIAAGEEPETIAKELSQARTKRDAEQVNTTDAAQWMEKAQAQIEASTVGPREKKIAQFALQKFAGSPSAQGKPDTGAKMFAEVEKALNAGRDKQVAGYVSKRKDEEFISKLSEGMQASDEKFGEKKFPGAFRRFGGDEPPDQPRTPAMQGHIDRQRAEKEKRYPGSTRQGKAGAPKAAAVKLPTRKLKQAKSEDDVVDALIEAGVPVTQENITAAEEVWRGGGG